MILSNKTAREMFAEIQARSTKPCFGIGAKVAMINVDVQCAYTDVVAFPNTAYETDPRQLEYTNAIAAACRALGAPVIWTHVAYLDSGEDCGVWGTRTDTPDSLQNIRHGSARARLDPRLDLANSDIIMLKRMASAFHETNLASLLTFHRVNSLIVTGGSTSGCVRATAVDGLSHSYRVTVPIECVADKHESPHFASLYDMAAKYADVVPAAEVLATLHARLA